MDNIYENIAYLRGLAEGISVEEDGKTGKLLLGMIDVLDDLAEEVEALSYDIEDVEEYLTFMDDDLSDVEECLFEYDDDYDDYDDYDEFIEDDVLED
ncbi:MAG: CD1247 N-terminal domain-containing protein [Miniphocaeibacter sp.]|jgi:hypothetical protein|uniref:CD1247 N-terminal domain-containing protein n=1 Tax=Miniphocaeibacter sp. TaxID=3100973 RepID=UPI0017967CFF|nr:hypothetical protein [Gallicola sp.]